MFDVFIQPSILSERSLKTKSAIFQYETNTKLLKNRSE